jgi:uncharacterized protein YjbJ (UPF0337 family)
LAEGVKSTVVESAGAAKTRVAGAADTVKGRVTDVAGTVREKVQDVTDTVKSSTQDILDRGRTVVGTKKEQVVAAIEAGKQAFDQKKSELEADVQQDVAESNSSGRTSSGDGSINASPTA